MLMRIPFDGFYQSESMAQLEDDFHEFDVVQVGFTQDQMLEEVNWKQVFEDFARLFAEKTQEELNDLGMNIEFTFAELISPKEYNFETDVILVELPDLDTSALVLTAHKNCYTTFKEVVEDLFTPRSGFIPFYSNDPDRYKWGSPFEWDHNELYAAFLSIIKAEVIDDLMERVHELTRQSARDIVVSNMSKKGLKMYDELMEKANA